MSDLQAVNIVKRYPGTVALDNVTVGFESGKIHAFVGKNGSGKSTLLKIFSGAVQKDSGDIILDGKPMNFANPRQAFEMGICTVYQELSTVPGMTVTENILLGRLPEKNGFIDWKEAHRKAGEILKDLNINIPVHEIAGDLSVGQCQMIEIAKAMSYNPKVLQLDEPTSALSKNDIQSLFKVLRELRDKGIIIIYVSHRLLELWEIADTCAVLRDGRYVGTLQMKDATRKDVIDMMFGDVEIKSRPADIEPGNEVILECKGLCRDGKFEDISFKLRKGEVLGVAGLMGSGRTELLRSLFGAEPFQKGELIYKGEHINKPTPETMKKLGMSMTQENRVRDGLVLRHTIKQNMNYAPLDVVFKNVFVKAGDEKRLALRQVEALDIKLASIEDSITSLSGGNQQKVVLGNWLNISPSIILLDEPSRGIDVKAKQQIFEIIWNLARQGISSVMVSSELEELLEVCHRIIIMKDGRFIGEVVPESVTIDELYSLCMGEEI